MRHIYTRSVYVSPVFRYIGKRGAYIYGNGWRARAQKKPARSSPRFRKSRATKRTGEQIFVLAAAGSRTNRWTETVAHKAACFQIGSLFLEITLWCCHLFPKIKNDDRPEKETETIERLLAALEIFGTQSFGCQRFVRRLSPLPVCRIAFGASVPDF